MRPNWIALFLSAAMALSLCGLPALAAEEPASVPAAQSQPENAEDAPGEEPAPEEPVPDPEGTVSFANLPGRVKSGNLTVLAWEENIAAIEIIDYDRLTDEIRDNLNQIADQQMQLYTMGSSFPDPTGMMQALTTVATSSATQSLQSAYDSLRDTFDDLKEGKIQSDNAGVVRQLRDAQNQFIKAAEALYISLTELENTAVTLERNLAALNRTVQEMELRHQLGQISALTLQEVTVSRASLTSSLQTLRMNLFNYKMQLELLLGAELTGELALTPLPAVTDEALDAMNLEEDLAAAKEASFALYDAKCTLDDAEETFTDARKQYGYSSTSYKLTQARHVWQAAQYTYENTVQNYELSFRILYQQVKDYRQALDAARIALSAKRDSYAATELKYQQGSISQNKLLEAADEVSAAEDTVTSAALSLFSAWNNYRWAVDFGILN